MVRVVRQLVSELAHDAVIALVVVGILYAAIIVTLTVMNPQR